MEEKFLKATAPYNFVALPEKILSAPFDVKNFCEYVSENGKFSGEILLRIETLTPLFIGGNGSKNFAPTGKPIIPGSSLRGMFKNIFKVVTCGAFRSDTDFNDEHIYFRCLMKNNKAVRNGYNWTKDLKRLYDDRMIHEDRGQRVKNARPGFLISVDNKYFVAPSRYKSDRKGDRLEIYKYLRRFKVEKSCVTWEGKRAYIFTGAGGKKKFVRFTHLDYVDWSREHWLPLSDEVLNSYRHDRNRRGMDLFTDGGILKRDKIARLTGKNLPDFETLIPCHYLEEGGQVTAFGHGQCFRIPYQKRIGDAVPKDLQSEVVDFADALFGKEKFWASRVYFEDATPEKISELAEATSRPLMQPNPTSYQLYLRQDGEKLKHWDSGDAQIRGYKLYWHNAVPNWTATQKELEDDKNKPADKRVTKEITPLDKGSVFESKIRFKNLSAIELGALMMIFDLNGAENIAYKIGQCKPFGFGSVKITPRLFIEDEAAYRELFAADGWKNPYREVTFDTYILAFKNYVKSCDMLNEWGKVTCELARILDWSQTEYSDWSAKIKSMSGDVSQGTVDERFIKRVPLPTIFDVVRK